MSISAHLYLCERITRYVFSAGESTMKKILPLLAVSTASAFLSPSIMAAQSNIETDMIEETVIVSSALKKNKAETALPVTVISGEALQQKASNTLGETLASTPGISSASFGPSVGQPIIRGQQGSRVRILQNSTGNVDASSSGADHAVTIEPVLAESIEVLKGPSTLLYGGGAIGGVINVIDNRIPSKSNHGINATLEQRFESAASSSTSVLKIDAGNDHWATHIDAIYRDWDDVEVPVDPIQAEHSDENAEHADHNSIHNSAGRTKSVTAGVSRLFDAGHIGVSVSQLNNQYGIPEGGHIHEEHTDPLAPTITEAHEEDVWIDLQQSRYDMAASYINDGEVLEDFNWHLSYTDYEHTEYEGATAATQYNSSSWEHRLTSNHSLSDNWQGVIGMQNQWREFQALAAHEADFDALVPETRHRANGLFIVESLRLDNWIHELGGRIDSDRYNSQGQNSSNHRFTSLSLSASSIWQFHDYWSTSVALSRSERAPSIDELYANVEGHNIIHGATGTIQLGNEDLSTEISNNIDLSLRLQLDRLYTDITLFYNDFEDYIYLLKTGHNSEHIDIYSYQQQDAVFKGIEISTNIELFESALWGDWELDIFADAIDGKNADGTNVPRLPPYRIGSTFKMHKNNWGSYVSIIHAAAQDKPGLNEDDSDSYTRIDAAVNYMISSSYTDTRLFLRIKNIGNAEIRNATSFLRDVAPEPGRSLEVGARISF